LLKENPNPTDAEINSRMQKHLCRCCSHPTILQAIRKSFAKGGPS
jgi:aerobic-type carbon monoxide dehydrogenase small subunit (CoxS/CutS family)